LSLSVPPPPADEAEKILVEAVSKALLDWAGVGEWEAEAPGYQTVLVPCSLSAELMGCEVLAAVKSRGLRLRSAPSGSTVERT